MKKVVGYCSVRPLGCYNFEFYVDDSASKEEIEEEIDKRCEYYINYDVEEGYEEYTETCYRKKDETEW